MGCSYCLDCFINKRVSTGSIGYCAGRKCGQIAATRAGTLTGPQKQFCSNECCPAITQAPGIMHMLRNMGLFHACRTEQLVDTLPYSIGKHMPESLIPGSCLGYSRLKRADSRFGSTLNAGDTQLCTHIHKQLVAP